MTTDLVTVTPEAEVETAASTILAEEAGSLVALDDGQLAGILTCTDLTELVSDGTVPADAAVSDYMTEDVTTTEPKESIQDAAVKMITGQIQHLPVIDDDAVVGMLSTTDLTAHLTYMDSSGTE